jgi:hypothetical protein
VKRSSQERTTPGPFEIKNWGILEAKGVTKQIRALSGIRRNFFVTIELGDNNKQITQAMQMHDIKLVRSYPDAIKDPFFMIINSNVDDLAAKYLGAYIASEVKVDFEWIKRYSYDMNVHNSKMLFLSNVTSESTHNRIEMVRNLIEEHDHVPRILMTSAPDIETIASRFRYQSSIAINLRVQK